TYWLLEMLSKACFSGLVYVLFATKPAQRNPRQIVVEPHFAHQVVTAAVRQSDIADEQIEFLGADFLHCLFRGMGYGNFVAVALQHSFHSDASVTLVFALRASAA